MIRFSKTSHFPWIQPDTDRDIANRAVAGDRRAFDQIVAVHEKALRGYIAMRVDSSGVDDVLQDTWTACWQGISRFSGRSRFKAWLYGIAANKCIDHHRTKSRRNETDIDAICETAATESQYADVENKEAVTTALARLPEAHREVLELYYYAELTLPEIASTLKRNLNTVKYQFYRAHDQMGRELDESRLP